MAQIPDIPWFPEPEKPSSPKPEASGRLILADGEVEVPDGEQLQARAEVVNALKMHEQASWGSSGIESDDEMAQRMALAEEAMRKYREEAGESLVAEVDGMAVTLDDYCEDTQFRVDDENAGEFVDSNERLTALEKELKKHSDRQAAVVRESQRLSGIRVKKDDDPDVEAQPLGF